MTATHLLTEDAGKLLKEDGGAILLNEGTLSMAATLTAQRIPITGVVPTLAAATALGDTVRPDALNRTFLWVDNADIGSHTVTLNDPRTALAVVGGPSGVSDGDLDEVVTVGAGAFKLIAVPTRFIDPATGFASITYDDVTSVTVGAFRAPAGVVPFNGSGTVLSTQKIPVSGLTPSFTNAAGSQHVKPGRRTFMLVKNAHSADHTLTINDPTSVSPVGAVAFNPDVTVNVAHATIYSFIGPVDGRFADSADTYRAALTWSLTTSMSIAVLSI